MVGELFLEGATMRRGVTLVVGACAMFAGVAALGQAAGTARAIDRRSGEQIAAQVGSMTAEAKESAAGLASVTLEKYPGHFTMLTVRTKSGGAELHAGWNDIFVVLDGEATEMTGGSIVDAKESSPGEMRGARLEGGTPTPMRKGDVIHIAPNTPHQTVLAPGKTFTYYVIKVEAPKP